AWIKFVAVVRTALFMTYLLRGRRNRGRQRLNQANVAQRHFDRCGDDPLRFIGCLDADREIVHPDNGQLPRADVDGAAISEVDTNRLKRLLLQSKVKLLRLQHKRPLMTLASI